MTTYTPEEYRTASRSMLKRTYPVREARTDEPDLYFNLGKAAGMLQVAGEQIAQLESDLSQRIRENDYLRAIVGNSDKACIYCGLGADEQAKCERGFPGCARGDDQMLCRNFGDAAALHDVEAMLSAANEKVKRLEELVNSQRKVIDAHQMLAETAPNPLIPERTKL